MSSVPATELKSSNPIQDALSEIVFHTILGEDGTLTFVYVNPRSKDLYGLSSEQLLRSPLPFMEHIHAEDRASYDVSLTNARETKERWEWEGRLVTPHGLYRWVRVSAAPQEGKDGTRWHGFFIDVTDTGRAALENETIQSVSRLLSNGDSQEHLLQSLVEVLAESLGFPTVVVDMKDAIGTIVRRAGVGGTNSPGGVNEVGLEETISGQVLRTGEIYACPDLRGATLFLQDPLVQMGARAVLFVPITRGDEVVGTIGLLDSRRRKLDAALRVTAQAVGNLLGQRQDRQEAEVRYQESMARFDLALQGTSDGLWDVKIPEGSVWSSALTVYYSRRFHEQLGYGEGTLPATLHSWSSRIHPADMDRVGRALAYHGFSKSPFDIEHRLRMQDGGYRWFNMRGQGLWAEGGGLTRVAGSLRDITARKTMEQAIQRSQREYRMLVELLPDGLAIVQGGYVAYANAALTRVLGVDDVGALMRQPIWERVVPDDRERMRSLMETLPVAADASPHEVQFVRPDESVIILDVTPVKQVRFKGADALLIVARDLTEKKDMQAKLYLADRMASMGTMAAGVAHEINNPLAFIAGNLDYLLDEFDLLEEDLESGRLDEVRAAVGDARTGAHRVSRIVRDLKTFSRVDEDALHPMSLGSILDSTLVMAQNQLRHRACLTRFAEEVPLVWGSEAKLGQVFLNLVINAIQSFEEDDPEKNCIQISVLDAGENVVVRVEDNGPGIPQKVLNRIFDPFFTTKPKGLGTGLGLSICHQIIRSMGGDIKVASESGIGSIFEVTLPSAVGDAAPAPIPTTHQASPVDLSGDMQARVLVIDDERSVGETLVRGLRSHEVTVVTRGHEALTAIEAGEEFDVVFCDVMMPEMTGMDMHARLKALSPMMAENVVFMTGGAFTPRAQAFLDSVENRVIEKPFDMRAVQALVAASTLA